MSVRTATTADRTRMVGILTSAFAADPVVRWMIGEQRCDERRLRAFFRAVLADRALAGGTCDLVEDAAAVWYPPGAHRPEPLLRTLLALPSWVAVLGPRLGAAARADAAMRARHPAEPHWYLQFLGVRAGRTGQGLGSALLRSRLDRLDVTGAAAYLETATPRNLPLYERHGFEILREDRLAEDAPLEWLMWRPRRRGADDRAQ